MDKNYKNLIEKLPYGIRNYISDNKSQNISEIRIRSNFDILVCLSGKYTQVKNTAMTQTEIESLLLSLCDNTLFAYEKEIANGYITVDGGHRIGIAGTFFEDSEGIHINEVSSLNIRIAQNKYFDIPDNILEFEKGLLILGSPHSGKTTFLKSICKQMTNSNIVVCDERNEIKDLSSACDFISGINKSIAIQQAVRTLNPDIIICDEIGSENESKQILSVMHSGVKFICTVHCNHIEELKYKPNIRLLIDSNVFDKFILLSNENNDFYIKEVSNV